MADEETERRVTALEAEVAALKRELSLLRAAPRPQDVLSRQPHRPSIAERVHDAVPVSGDEIESLVGRYGTLALAALVILMAVGAVIRMAVQAGLLTPAVRVASGALVATAFAIAGLVFRRRGEVRYGGVLLAVALAVLSLVAWGAGPRFHLVPTAVALIVVDVAALGVVLLALRDASEFLFVIGVAGALSAPYVTADEPGAALPLLAYGAVVIAGAVSAVRDARWLRAAALLVAGAFVYSLAAGALPIASGWYGPYLIALLGGACALAALTLGATAWKSELSRAFLAVSFVGVMLGWDVIRDRPLAMTLPVALALAALTHVALALRAGRTGLWRTSAVLLPFVSLGMAFVGSVTRDWGGPAAALWTVFALASWQLERTRREPARSGAHLLSAALLGGLATIIWVWKLPLAVVAGLAACAVGTAWLGRDEESALPLAGVGVLAGGAALSAFDQLLSRGAYSYIPFWTRSSGSAAVATAGLALAGWAMSRGPGAMGRLAGRAVQLGAPIGFAIVWGRMEVAQAYSPDLAAFLLTSYYAACGVASIVAGRRLGITPLRVAGLALAVYAAVKALVEVTNIGSVPLRVGAYAAVGLFLLAAGWTYRGASTTLERRLADRLT